VCSLAKACGDDEKFFYQPAWLFWWIAGTSDFRTVGHSYQFISATSRAVGTHIVWMTVK